MEEAKNNSNKDTEKQIFEAVKQSFSKFAVHLYELSRRCSDYVITMNDFAEMLKTKLPVTDTAQFLIELLGKGELLLSGEMANCLVEAAKYHKLEKLDNDKYRLELITDKAGIVDDKRKVTYATAKMHIENLCRMFSRER